MAQVDIFFLKILFLVLVFISPALCQSDYFLDIDGYIKYDTGNQELRGIEDRLAVKFKFCNDRGILIYQDGGASFFFAMGVNAGKIYLEWKTSDQLIELYIGDDDGLQPNTTYEVEIFGLKHRLQTQAWINGRQARVDYLTSLNGGLDATVLDGHLFVGGYQDVTDLGRINTERLTAYLIVCLDYITAGTSAYSLNFTAASELVGVRGCPSDFCALSTELQMLDVYHLSKVDGRLTYEDCGSSYAPVYQL